MGPSADGAIFCHMAHIIPGKANHDAEDTESGGDTIAASAEEHATLEQLITARSSTNDFCIP